jgi:hypothetical protein
MSFAPEYHPCLATLRQVVASEVVLWLEKICAWFDGGYHMVCLILSYLDLDQKLDANMARRISDAGMPRRKLLIIVPECCLSF